VTGYKKFIAQDKTDPWEPSCDC